MTTPPRDAACAGCARPLCGRQTVISGILGSGSLKCLKCLSQELGSTPEQVCKLVGGYLARRECYRSDWLAAAPCGQDGQAACCPSRLENSGSPPAWFRPELFAAQATTRPEPDLVVDAEESGCGDLMVLLMRSIRKLAPGEVLELTARDPGAQADIPAWSRLTGNSLLAGPEGPDRAIYLIRRKSQSDLKP